MSKGTDNSIKRHPKNAAAHKNMGILLLFGFFDFAFLPGPADGIHDLFNH